VIRVALLLFDEVDLLDVGGPYEVFLTANRLSERDGRRPPFDVVTVTLDGAPVTAYGGMGLVPQAAIADVDDIGILVVPGAVAIDRVLGDERLIQVVRERSQGGNLVASVCTGAFVLGAAGLLEGRPFTTHFEDLSELARRTPSAEPREAVRWVDDGSIVTAGGLSSGIAAALHLVARLTDPSLAEVAARQIDYVWTENR